MKFAYRFHPFFGQDVRVIRRLRADVDAMVIVQGGPDLRIVAPSWMLDEDCCSAMAIGEFARISVEALVALRSLIDAWGLLARGVPEGCASLMANGHNHELPAKGRTKGIDPDVGSTAGGT